MSTFDVPEMQGTQEEGMNEVVDEKSMYIEYYTDPLCSWSWAFEPQWRYLRFNCGERLTWRYRMGGLLPDWESYQDPFNDVGNPAQMRPQWLQVRDLSGMPLNEQIWAIDPPASSYPSCIAVKAAERQGQAVAEDYLRRLREAVMMEQRNIARQDILLAIAEEMVQSPGKENSLDLHRFYNDLNSPETLEAFRQDLRDAAYYGIGRFPTLVLHRTDGRGIVLVGYRPYNVLAEALDYLVPGSCRKPEVTVPQEELAYTYVTRFLHTTTRELAEVFQGNMDQATAVLETLVAGGVLGDISRSATPIYAPISQFSDSPSSA